MNILKMIIVGNVPTSTFSQHLQNEGITKDTSHASGVFYKGIKLPVSFEEDDDTEIDKVDSDEEIDTTETESNYDHLYSENKNMCIKMFILL